MTIGLPKALLYYRYHKLWNTFFSELGCDVVTSEDTCRDTLAAGSKNTVDENCLPLKVYMGHVRALIGRCDYILIPRFENDGKNEEFCVRLFGLYDIVRNTYENTKLLTYNHNASKRESELFGFIRMGHALGKNTREILRAYQKAKNEQQRFDHDNLMRQNELLKAGDLKIMIAAQPYVIHDPYIGKPIIKMINSQGGQAVFSDFCDRKKCKKASKNISSGLYWTMNKETIGSIVSCKNMVDGVVLLTAFPCGSDSLVNEMVIRKVKDIPIVQILIDEQQAEAGLQTRIESFVDILQERRRSREK